MKVSTIAPVFVLSARSLAGPINGQLYECNGLYKPDYKAADKFFEDWANDDGVLDNSEPKDCHIFTHADDAENLAVWVCWENHDESASAPKKGLAGAYRHVIKKWCEPADAGGKYFLDDGTEAYLGVWNNPDYTGPPDEKDDDKEVKLKARSRVQRRSANGFVESKISKTDLNEIFDLTPATSFSERKKRGILDTPKLIKGVKKIADVEDDAYTVRFSEKNVAKPGERYKASNILDPGVEETWSFSDTKTVETSMSTELSAGFLEIFSASVGMSVSQATSKTVEEGKTFTAGDCPKKAVVYWEPLFDHYVGYWESEPEKEWEAWIPVPASNAKFAGGRWETECIDG